MLKKILLSSFLVLFVLALPTFIPLGEKESGGKIVVYLISNEIHTDLVLPVKNEIYDWEKFWNAADFKKRPGEWVEIGWGDKEFYRKVPTWNEFRLSIALKALFLPGDSAIHINYVEGNPEYYPAKARLEISPETYKKIVATIRDQFVLKKGKPLVLVSGGYSEADNFYEAHGSFSIFRTCNTWTSDVLAEAGLLHPLWSPTKYGLEMIWY